MVSLKEDVEHTHATILEENMKRDREVKLARFVSDIDGIYKQYVPRPNQNPRQRELSADGYGFSCIAFPYRGLNDKVDVVVTLGLPLDRLHPYGKAFVRVETFPAPHVTGQIPTVQREFILGETQMGIMDNVALKIVPTETSSLHIDDSLNYVADALNIVHNVMGIKDPLIPA